MRVNTHMHVEVRECVCMCIDVDMFVCCACTRVWFARLLHVNVGYVCVTCMPYLCVHTHVRACV